MADAPVAPPSGRTTTVRGGALIALVGAVAAAGLYSFVPGEESSRTVKAEIIDPQTVQLTALSGPMHLRAYRDDGGVWSICDGDTDGVGASTVETPQGCVERLERQLVNHAKPVKRCLPGLWSPGGDYRRWAVIDLAYNEGDGTVCGATGLHAMLARDAWTAAAERMLAYDVVIRARPIAGAMKVTRLANGKYASELRGLWRRRHREREVMLTNVAPGDTPANLQMRMGKWK